MKRLLTVTIFALMALPAFAEPGPRPGTAEALQCLIGVREEASKCLKLFRGRAQSAAAPWVFHNEEQLKRDQLMSATYWGRANRSNIFDVKVLRNWPVQEMDIYDVKFPDREYTFYIAPADADGRIRALAIGLYGPRDLAKLSGMRG